MLLFYNRNSEDGLTIGKYKWKSFLCSTEYFKNGKIEKLMIGGSYNQKGLNSVTKRG